jgi:transposase
MDGVPPSFEELIDLTRRQVGMIEALRAEVERLKKELEEARRAGKRQAAPFSKGAPESNPKRPGRKPGHPPSHRTAPPPEQIDRTVEVPMPPNCPGCHAPLGAAPVTVHDQYQIDLPEPKPVITRFRVPVARCPACYRRVQGRPPSRPPTPWGLRPSSMGPDCSASPRRLAQPSYDRLVEAARHSAVQHVDETGWKIGGRSAWLWVFADARATVYRIRGSRGHEVVVEVLGDDYQGVLVSDCFLAYDPLNFTKSKCSAHLLKRCSEVEQSKSRGAVRFSRRVAALLRRAMALKRRRGTISDHGYAVLRGRVHAALDRLLAGTYTDPDNARLAKLLRKHRDSVLRFLDHDGVDATNNLAEREVRPAVIARELSAGNRTEGGAEAHAVLASVFRTYRRQVWILVINERLPGPPPTGKPHGPYALSWGLGGAARLRDKRACLSSSVVSSTRVAIVHTCPDGSMTHAVRSPQN